MADKRVKAFSPYNYGIKYRVPGKNPFQKYQYVPGAGGGAQESLYIVTKISSNFFTNIMNHWYFDISEDGTIKFVKCESEIGIYDKKIGESYSINSTFINTKSQIVYIKSSEDDVYYKWQNSNTVKILNKQPILSDIVILLNNEYYNEKCDIINNETNFYITFKREINKNDEIVVIIYPIGASIGYFNNSFNLNESIELKKVRSLDKIVIKNEFGNINDRYLILNSQNKIYHLDSYNIEPLYIEFNNINDINKIYSYSPKDNMETFIIQYGIDTENIKWNFNNLKYRVNREEAEWITDEILSVEIMHNLKGYVNYILDNNDDKQIIKTIKRINDNKIKIEFNRTKYQPNVISVTLFKISN